MRQIAKICDPIHRSFSCILRLLKHSLKWILKVSSHINFQLAALTIAILISGFVFSARLNYIHNFRLFDMSAYSYARLAEVQYSPQKELYRELATKYLMASEDYRQAAARTTDMFASSLISIILFFVAILMKLSFADKDEQHFTAVPVVLAFLFLLLTLLLWFPWPTLEPFRRVDFLGMVRELPRWDFIDQLIQSTGYLRQVIPCK